MPEGRFRKYRDGDSSRQEDPFSRNIPPKPTFKMSFKDTMNSKGLFTVGDFLELDPEQLADLRSCLPESEKIYLQCFLDAAKHPEDTESRDYGNKVRTLLKDKSIAAASDDIGLVAGFFVPVADGTVVVLSTSKTASNPEKGDVRACVEPNTDHSGKYLPCIESCEPSTTESTTIFDSTEDRPETDEEIAFMEIEQRRISRVHLNGHLPHLHAIEFDIRRNHIELILTEHGASVGELAFQRDYAKCILDRCPRLAGYTIVKSEFVGGRGIELQGRRPRCGCAVM